MGGQIPPGAYRLQDVFLGAQALTSQHYILHRGLPSSGLKASALATC